MPRKDADDIRWIESDLKELTMDDYFLLRANEVVRKESAALWRDFEKITKEDKGLLERLANG